MAKFLGFLLILAGLFFLGVVVFRDAKLALLGKRTHGVVESITEKRNSDSYDGKKRGNREASYSYRLHVRFETSPGQEVRFSTLSTFGRESREGDRVEVIYLTSDPEQAEIYSARQLWLPMLTGFALSFLCVGGGGVLMRTGRG